MNTKPPTVSIGLPVYNGEEYLREAIESNLAQTFSDFELIISDNASTDGTGEICREYASRDERIRYFRFDANQGAARNYNRVFELACGKYFRWTTSDDRIGPTLVERCVEVLDRKPDVILCYPKTVLIDRFGDEFEKFDDKLDLRQSSVIERFSSLRRDVSLCNVIYGLIRSDPLRQTRLMGGYIGSDIAMLSELVLYGRFYEIPEYLFFRRFHPKALSSDKSVENQQQFFDPKTLGTISLPCFRHPYQNLLSIARSPVPFREKSALFYLVLRELISSRDEIVMDILQMIRALKVRIRKA